MSFLIRLFLMVCVLCPSLAGAVKGVTVMTTYDDDLDTFFTEGEVKLRVPIKHLAKVAGDLDGYRRWALRGINVKANGKSFIIKLRDVRHYPGRPMGKGHFLICFLGPVRVSFS